MFFWMYQKLYGTFQRDFERKEVILANNKQATKPVEIGLKT